VDKDPPRFDRSRADGECRDMTLHLIKLCVGCDSIEDLAEWIDERRKAARRAGRKHEHVHVTRMVPKRMADLLDGGSLYWVIKGSVQVRQALLDIQVFTDGEGIQRCRLVLDTTLVPTEWQPKRPFQGWRYYDPKDVPPDLRGDRRDDLPPALKAELSSLGLM
jgi:hypothetical protein